jgi:hypothetical protein
MSLNHLIALANGCLQQSLDFAEIALRAVLVVELVKSPDLGSRKSNTAKVLVGCVLYLMNGSYFQFIPGERKRGELFIATQERSHFTQLRRDCCCDFSL